MDNPFTVTFPYPVGTFLVKRENNQKHVDQIFKYVVRRNGVSAILVLDVTTKPTISREISLEELESNWVLDDGRYNEEDVSERRFI